MAMAAATGPITEGVIREVLPGAVVLGLPGSDYRLHLLTDGADAAGAPGGGGGRAAPATASPAAAGPETAEVPGSPSAPGVQGVPVVGHRVRGRILVRATRVDALRAGGRFIEPVFGRPRRVHGVVTATDRGANTLVVACAPGCAVTAELTANQQASQFPVGTLVGFDVERGARFVPEMSASAHR